MRSSFWKMRSIIVVAALLGLSLSACGRASPDSGSAGGTTTEGDAPASPDGHALARDFSLTALDGDVIRLSDYRGDVVVVNFWATWCGPCRVEIPDFIAMQQELAGDGFHVIGIALDDEGVDVVRPYARQMNINYPIVVDDGDVAEAYGAVYSLPTTFLIDRSGHIRQRFMSQVSRALLQPLVDTLLNEAAGPAASDPSSSS